MDDTLIGILFWVLIPLIIVLTLLKLFGPKDLGKFAVKDFILSRTTLSVFMATAVVSLSILYTLYIADPLSNSIFDWVIGIPAGFVFAIGLGAGETAGLVTVFVEVLLLTFLIRLFIPQKALDNWKKK